MRRLNLSGELTNYKFISGGNQKAMEINKIVNLLKSCQQLQTLQIDVLRLPSKLAFNSLLNMIKHNRMISKLNFKSESIPLFKVDMYDVLRLANDHPFLVELELLHGITVNNAILLICKMESMKRLSFPAKNPWVYENSALQLSHRWRFTAQTERVTLIRKN